MLISALDIETTGLDEEVCQVIEIGAVIFDTNHLHDSFEILKKFHCYVLHDTYRGEPYALGMHAEIFKRISKREQPYLYLRPHEVAVELPKFLKLHMPEEEKYTIAGKNVSAFDMKFFRADPYLKPIVKSFHHRCVDVGNMYVDWRMDKCLPSTEECLKRAMLSTEVKHNAVDDCLQVIELLRCKIIASQMASMPNPYEYYPPWDYRLPQWDYRYSDVR